MVLIKLTCFLCDCLFQHLRHFYKCSHGFVIIEYIVPYELVPPIMILLPSKQVRDQTPLARTGSDVTDIQIQPPLFGRTVQKSLFTIVITCCVRINSYFAEHYLLKVHPLFPVFCLFPVNVDDLTTLIG